MLIRWHADIIVQVNWEFVFPVGQPVQTDGFSVTVNCLHSKRQQFPDHAAAVAYARSLIPQTGGAVYEDLTNRTITGPVAMLMDQHGPRPWAYEKIDYWEGVSGRALPSFIDEDGIGSGWSWRPFPSNEAITGEE